MASRRFLELRIEATIEGQSRRCHSRLILDGEVIAQGIERLTPDPYRRARLLRLAVRRPSATDPSQAARLVTGILAPSVQAALTRYRTVEALVGLCAPPELAVLPWECLEVGEVKPFLAEAWDLIRLVGEPKRPPVTLLPEVLLVVGSTRQRAPARSSRHDVKNIVKSISDAGFRCEVAGSSSVQVPVQHPLVHRRDLNQVLEQQRFSIVHYVGHLIQQPGSAMDRGNDSLALEFAQGEPWLPAADLTSALRAARTRLFVATGCDGHDLLQRALLGPAAVDAVASFGADVDPDLCALWTRSFYQALRADDVITAARTARRALELDHGGRWKALKFVPQLAARHLGEIRRADAEAQTLARYRDWVIAQHSGYFAPFDQAFGAALVPTHVKLKVTETQVPKSADQPTSPHHRVLAKLEGRTLTFEQLMAEPHRVWTLGGEPGAGKTTTLRWYAQKLARDDAADVPIYLYLPVWLADEDVKRWWQNHEGLAGCVGQYLGREAQLDLASALDALGRQHRLVVLLDGYDELDEAQGELLGKILTVLRRDWPACRIVIGTRRYSSAKRLPEDFGGVDIQPLLAKEAATLLQDLLARREETEPHAAAWAADWLIRFASDHAWRALSRVPLFVSLLALQLVGDDVDADGEPKRSYGTRHGFFAAVFELLMQGKHRPKATRQALEDPDAALALLRRIALRMTSERQVVVDKKQLRVWFGHNVSASLDPIARRTLILGPVHTRPGAPWKFWHRQFQEALCAEELQQQVDREGLDAVWRAVGKIQPSPERIQETREEMRKRWRADYDRFWVDRQDLWAASLPNLGPIRSELNRLDNEIQRLRLDNQDCGALWSQREDLVAEHLAPVLAARAEREYWTETLALLAERLESNALVLALVRRDPELGRRVAESRDRLEPKTALVLLRRLPRLNDRSRLLARLVEQVKAEPLVAVLCRIGAKILNATARPEDARGQLELIEAALDRLPESEAVGQVRTRLRHACTQRSLVKADEARWLRVATRPELPLWVPVPAGSFTMGSATATLRPLPGTVQLAERFSRALRIRVAPSRYADEGPAEVTIAQQFWISATPVTVGLYRLFDRGETTEWQGNKALSKPGDDADSLPMTGVSWYAASMFCRWASTVLLPPIAADLQIDSEQFEMRLPTEAEWEYSARGDKPTRYFFGNDARDLEHYAWFGRADGRPQAVASKSGKPGDGRRGANGFGLFDVHGNVWEWCEDWYGKKLEGGQDPRGPGEPSSSGALRVLRGGGFRSTAGFCRSAKRFKNSPDTQYGNTGFRVVVAARRPRRVIEDRT